MATPDYCSVAGDFEIMMFHPQNEYTIGREQCHTISPEVATLAIMTHTAMLPVSIGPLESVHRVSRDLCHWSLFIGSGETCVKRRSKEAVWELESIYIDNTTRNSECRLCHDVTHNKLVEE